ncbi:MAG: hypothetical protein HGB12_03365 [Bacteroidetes bacterium]|nr:hypothetical protein [Bacteroidota bacterium]
MKNKYLYLLIKSIVCSFFVLYFSLSSFKSTAQGVAINVSGDSAAYSAILDLQPDTSSGATSKGILIPRMRTANRPLSPEQGLQIYNTTTNCLEIYVGSSWQAVVCGCTNAPAAAGTISGTATVCPGQIAVLYSVPAIARATSYIWSYSGTGAVIVGSTNTVIIYFSGTATSGNLTVQGSNACGNGTVSNNYAISVNSTAPNITGQPVSVTTCPGSGTASFTVTASGGLSYQWQEYTSSWNNVANAGVYSNVTTATLSITNPPSGMNGNKYRCIVSGTCTNTTSDGEATLIVSSIPSVTNTSTANTCSGTSPNITLTSNVSSNFAWTVGTITGSITGASASSGATINQTLTNPSNATAGSVQYLVTPTSTAGSCVGSASAINITVNPTPTVTNTPLTQSICSAGSTTLVTLTSNVSGTTFAWTTSASAGISDFTSSGTSTIPVQTINNSVSTAGTVTYAITPTANGCAGSVANYITTVNPLAAAPTATAVTGATANQFTANWNTVTGATSYALDVSTTSGFTSGFVINNQNVGNVLTNNVTGLTAGTTYYYRVRAVDACGAGFNSNTITAKTSFTVSALVVGGGAGGGSRDPQQCSRGGGGGGAGGYQESTITVVSGTPYTITVGNGGNGATTSTRNGETGGTSSIGSLLVSVGGGGGGGNDNGVSGASGGGSSGYYWSGPTGGSGIAGQGYAGGVGAGESGGGGGGGAGGVGSSGNGGAGGVGRTSSISGSSVTYATGGKGGNGGCGSSNGTPGASNTGNGGGGIDGGGSTAANGGSGIVIISYPTAYGSSTGGTQTTSGSNTVVTFTSSGTWTPNW